MESKENLLEVKNLSVDFRMDRKTVLHAVRNVSFTLEKGETLGLVGESGCGKSVSCMSILQLNPPQRTLYPTGEILFDGKDLLKMNQKQLRPIRGNEIAMVFQEPMTAMNPLFTIGDQLMEALATYRRKGYAVDNEEETMGVKCVAMAIRTGRGDVAGAISISGPAISITPDVVDQYSDLLARACNTLTQCAHLFPAIQLASN